MKIACLERSLTEPVTTEPREEMPRGRRLSLPVSSLAPKGPAEPWAAEGEIVDTFSHKTRVLIRDSLSAPPVGANGSWPQDQRVGNVEPATPSSPTARAFLLRGHPFPYQPRIKVCRTCLLPSSVQSHSGWVDRSMCPVNAASSENPRRLLNAITFSSPCSCAASLSGGRGHRASGPRCGSPWRGRRASRSPSYGPSKPDGRPRK